MEEMARLNRITDFWNWLPAFRAVAETEHVGRAAEKVYRSPSSLSRAISLLEDDLGVALFEKSGRRIRLTEAGREFLEIVRRAMRLVDDGMVRVTETELHRRLYVQVSHWSSWMVEGAASALVAGSEDGELEIVTSERELRSERLLDGELDLLLTHVPMAREELDTHNVATLTNALYAAADHPIFDEDREDPWTPGELRDYDFVAPVAAGDADAPDEWPRDGWPREFPRSVRCTVDRPRLTARVAAGTELLAALPVRLVERDERLAEELARVPQDFLLETPVFAVRRAQLVDDDLTARVIERISRTPPFRAPE